MIQIKRGNTINWRKLKTKLKAGQPGYDKIKHKLKIGDGEHLWNELPYVSGLSARDIFYDELAARERFKADPEDTSIITFGTDAPDKDTVGQLYLQHYDSEPEADYIVSFGTDGIWTYQKWKSGIAKCWGTREVEVAIQDGFENENLTLFCDASGADTGIGRVDYPFKFKDVPSESATLMSPAGLVWLASRGNNSKSKSGTYRIISPDELDSAKYKITLHVEGYWR